MSGTFRYKYECHDMSTSSKDDVLVKSHIHIHKKHVERSRRMCALDKIRN